MKTSLPPSRFFPPAESASEEGLVGVGGDLSPEWLLDAYRHGIFPWPTFPDDQLVMWWSPNPRAVIELDQFHVSRRLRRTIRSGKFEVTCDRDFFGVIDGCAVVHGRQDGTWITPAMLDAYVAIHRLGSAHSVEVWHGGELAGGVYGVAVGGLFAAESMFHLVRDASKVALAYLVAHLAARGYQLLDIQQLTAHTESLGATEISRRQYLERLAAAVDLPVTFGDSLEVNPGA